MTYVEKTVMEIGGSVANHHCNQGTATLIVEKIIADTKRADIEAVEDALEHNKTMCDWCIEAIASAEVKGE